MFQYSRHRSRSQSHLHSQDDASTEEFMDKLRMILPNSIQHSSSPSQNELAAVRALLLSPSFDSSSLDVGHVDRDVRMHRLEFDEISDSDSSLQSARRSLSASQPSRGVTSYRKSDSSSLRTARGGIDQKSTSSTQQGERTRRRVLPSEGMRSMGGTQAKMRMKDSQHPSNGYGSRNQSQESTRIQSMSDENTKLQKFSSHLEHELARSQSSEEAAVKMLLRTFSLISSQQVDIDRLNVEKHRLEGDLFRARDELEEKKGEIERMRLHIDSQKDVSTLVDQAVQGLEEIRLVNDDKKKLLRVIQQQKSEIAQLRKVVLQLTNLLETQNPGSPQYRLYRQQQDQISKMDHEALRKSLPTSRNEMYSPRTADSSYPLRDALSNSYPGPYVVVYGGDMQPPVSARSIHSVASDSSGLPSPLGSPRETIIGMKGMSTDSSLPLNKRPHNVPPLDMSFDQARWNPSDPFLTSDGISLPRTDSEKIVSANYSIESSVRSDRRNTSEGNESREHSLVMSKGDSIFPKWNSDGEYMRSVEGSDSTRTPPPSYEDSLRDSQHYDRLDFSSAQLVYPSQGFSPTSMISSVSDNSSFISGKLAPPKKPPPPVPSSQDGDTQSSKLRDLDHPKEERVSDMDQNFLDSQVSKIEDNQSSDFLVDEAFRWNHVLNTNDMNESENSVADSRHTIHFVYSFSSTPSSHDSSSPKSPLSMSSSSEGAGLTKHGTSPSSDEEFIRDLAYSSVTPSRIGSTGFAFDHDEETLSPDGPTRDPQHSVRAELVDDQMMKIAQAMRNHFQMEIDVDPLSTLGAFRVGSDTFSAHSSSAMMSHSFSQKHVSQEHAAGLKISNLMAISNTKDGDVQSSPLSESITRFREVDFFNFSSPVSTAHTDEDPIEYGYSPVEDVKEDAEVCLIPSPDPS